MRIDWWTLSLQTINAVVLIWLLAYFLFKPVASVIAARKAEAARLIEEAELAKAAALSLRDEETAALAEITEQRAAALTAAKSEADAQRETLLAAARQEANRMREEARSETAQQLDLLRDAQIKYTGALALDIARRLVERFPPSSRVSGFIDGLAEAVAALPEESRKNFEADGGAYLKSPRALSPEELADCRRAFEIGFGRPLVFSVEVDPALIAGLELENSHTKICNSLRADLVAIAASLNEHDQS
jgi:F-type H+-transporting ATPase subunit b